MVDLVKGVLTAVVVVVIIRLGVEVLFATAGI